MTHISKSRGMVLFPGLPAWGTALLAAVASFCVLFFLGYALRSLLGNESVADGIAYFSYDLLIALACFYICRIALQTARVTFQEYSRRAPEITSEFFN